MSLTKYGSGTLTLGNNHTFTGTTTIQGGTIKAGALAVTGGASSLGNATSAVTLGGTLGKGALVYTGNSATFTRGFTIGSGGGQLDATISGQTLTLGTGNIAAGGPLTFGGNGNIQINSVVSGSGRLTKPAPEPPPSRQPIPSAARHQQRHGDEPRPDLFQPRADDHGGVGLFSNFRIPTIP